MKIKRKSRSTADRIRYALSFEVIGILLSAPLGAWVFDMPLFEIGVVGFLGATIATLWNFGYNLLFDSTLLAMTGSAAKSLPVRVAHAVLFEVGLIAVLMPVIAWYLDVGLWTVFVMDIGFSVFYMVYAFIFDAAYMAIYPPVPAGQR